MIDCKVANPCKQPRRHALPLVRASIHTDSLYIRLLPLLSATRSARARSSKPQSYTNDYERAASTMKWAMKGSKINLHTLMHVDYHLQTTTRLSDEPIAQRPKADQNGQRARTADPTHQASSRLAFHTNDINHRHLHPHHVRTATRACDPGEGR
jgi:hypothetical protein